jgi:hypothetical protein
MPVRRKAHAVSAIPPAPAVASRRVAATPAKVMPQHARHPIPMTARSSAA